MRTKYISALMGAFALGACTYDFPVQEPPTLGQTDFSKMVAVGNSITAGFMDGALYSAAQTNSYPAIIARQAAALGGASFPQPSVNSLNGCFNPAAGCTQGRLVLRNPLSPAPAPTAGDNGASLARFPGAISNWGVPGVTLLTSLIPQTGGPAIPANTAFNPFYARIASTPGTSTLISDAAAALANGGSFFTFWLGNNDVLGYATGGASNPAMLTSQADFQTRFNQALNAMLNARADAEGAVANIPNVGTIPFFTTVPVNPVPLDAATTAVLNTNFGGYNATLDAFKAPPFNLPAAEMDGRKIRFTAGPGNRVVLTDETARDMGPFWDQLVTAGALPAAQRAALEPYRRARQAVAPTATAAGDLIVLIAATFIGTTVGGNPLLVNGVSVPLADMWVLLPSEQVEVQNAVNGYNTIIKAAVDAQPARLVLVDMNKALADVRAGLVSIRGSAFTSSITPPFGAFSLDGVHPNQRGQGYVANQFIQAINAKWGAKIPPCNPNDFAGNALPIP